MKWCMDAVWLDGWRGPGPDRDEGVQGAGGEAGPGELAGGPRSNPSGVNARQRGSSGRWSRSLPRSSKRQGRDRRRWGTPAGATRAAEDGSGAGLGWVADQIQAVTNRAASLDGGHPWRRGLGGAAGSKSWAGGGRCRWAGPGGRRGQSVRALAGVRSTHSRDATLCSMRTSGPGARNLLSGSIGGGSQRAPDEGERGGVAQGAEACSQRRGHAMQFLVRFLLARLEGATTAGKTRWRPGKIQWRQNGQIRPLGCRIWSATTNSGGGVTSSMLGDLASMASASCRREEKSEHQERERREFERERNRGQGAALVLLLVWRGREVAGSSSPGSR